MSSLSSKFSTTVFPSLNAARSKHLLLNDLDPGRVTIPSNDLIGVTVNVSTLWLEAASAVCFLPLFPFTKANPLADWVKPSTTMEAATIFMVNKSISIISIKRISSICT
jgi:hypothetical protein